MLVILGKNGSGKTFLANKLFDLGFYRSVNCTTRPKREGEIDGLDYKFISNEKFERLITEEYFIEFKKRNDFYYGTPKQNIKSNAILLAGDVNKIRTISTEEVVPLYIDANIETRFKRVGTRGEPKEVIFKRFHDENFSYLYDFNGFFIDNRNADESALLSIMEIIDSEGRIVDRTQLCSNIDFIRTQTQIVPEENHNEMFTFLQFEEYLLRKMIEMFDIVDAETHQKMVEYYYDQMDEYLSLYGISSSRKSLETMELILDREKYQADFQKERLLRRKYK